MNGYSSKLAKAAVEVRALALTADDRSVSSKELERLALHFERAGASSEAAVGAEIEALAHYLVDSWPLSIERLPSFGEALDAYQRANKRRGNR